MSVSYLSSNDVLDVPYISFPDLLKKSAKDTPNKEICIFFDENNERSVLTCGELYDKATKFARALVQMGIKRGDIIGLSGRNVPEWLIADLGVQMAGGCSLCLPYQQKEEDCVRLFNSIGNVKLLITDPGADGQNHHAVKSIIDKMDSSDVPGLQHVILFFPHESLPSLYNVQDLCSHEIDAALPRIDPEDIAIILMSSGTTSLPKAIPHSHHALVVLSFHFVNGFKTNNEKEALYNDRPFFWGGGYPYWEVGSGGTRVTLKNALHLTSMAEAALTACGIIARENATQALLAPSMIDLILKRNINLKVQRIITGSMVVYSSSLESIGKICDEYQIVYASTELGFISTRIYTADDKASVKYKVLSCRPVPGVEIKVTDDNGFLQPVGQQGKIWIRSFKRFPGYLNHTILSESEEYFRKSGWFSLDDGGFVTDDNFLIVEGRRQEMIQVFGRQIYPVEIENVIKSKGNVIAAIVMPIKDIKTGDLVPSAAIIYRPQSEDSTESMQDYLRKEFNITTENKLLGCLYVPHVIISLKEFPLLANGKPNRRAIRQIVLGIVDKKKYD